LAITGVPGVHRRLLLTEQRDRWGAHAERLRRERGLGSAVTSAASANSDARQPLDGLDRCTRLTNAVRAREDTRQLRPLLLLIGRLLTQLLSELLDLLAQQLNFSSQPFNILSRLVGCHLNRLLAKFKLLR
jgi:hypothetical protein